MGAPTAPMPSRASQVGKPSPALERASVREQLSSIKASHSESELRERFQSLGVSSDVVERISHLCSRPRMSGWRKRGRSTSIPAPNRNN